jgi:hypothetical protein
MSQAKLEKKVKDIYAIPSCQKITGNDLSLREQLQAEIDRMAQHTRQPEVLS